jgi:hypothetical protein
MKHQLELTTKEGKFMVMAVAGKMEDLHKAITDPEYHWNQETLATLKEMYQAGKSLAAKLEKISGQPIDLPPLLPGEEKNYFTKPPNT